MKTKKLHKCRSIKEYREILRVYNGDSAFYFNGLNKVDSDWVRSEYMRQHPNKRFGKK